MIPKSNYSSLSGSFRLTSKEYGATQYLRYRMRMNIQHISEVIKRSKASVHRVLRLNPAGHVDNRGQTHTQYVNRLRHFHAAKREIIIRVRLYFLGIAESMREAFEARVFDKVVASIISENSDGEDEEDPA